MKERMFEEPATSKSSASSRSSVAWSVLEVSDQLLFASRNAVKVASFPSCDSSVERSSDSLSGSLVRFLFVLGQEIAGCTNRDSLA